MLTRPKNPAQAEAAVASGVPLADLDLVPFERDILVAGCGLFSEAARAQALINLGANPLLLRDGSSVSRVDPADIRAKTASRTLSDAQVYRLEQLSRLAVAIGELRQQTSELPALIARPDVTGGVLVVPVAAPFYRTRVAGGRVVRGRNTRFATPASRKRSVPDGGLVVPWQLPWVYLLRAFLPSRLGIFQSTKPRRWEEPNPVRDVGHVVAWPERAGRAAGFEPDEFIRPIPRGRLSAREQRRRAALAAAVTETIRLGAKHVVVADALGTNTKQIQRLLRPKCPPLEAMTRTPSRSTLQAAV